MTKADNLNNKKIKNRNIVVQDNNTIIINEMIETTMDKASLKAKLEEINYMKDGIKRRNAQLIKEYNDLVEQEEEILSILSQIKDNDENDIDEIEKL